MSKLTIAVLIISFISTNSFGQLIVKDQSTPPNTLLQVNDEGPAGSITLPILPSVGDPTFKLYNHAGSLYWNGSALDLENAGGWTHAGNIIYNTNLDDKVGIGTNNPLSRLSVGGPGSFNAALAAESFSFTAIYGFSGGNGVGGEFTSNGNSGTGVYGRADGLNGVGVNGVSQNGFAGSFGGKVRIGYNSSGSAVHLLLLETEDDYSRLSFQNYGPSPYLDHFWTIAALNKTNEADARFHIYNNTNGNLISITGDGNVGIGTGNGTPAFKLHVNGTAGKPGGGSWSVASDIRLKKDIEEFTDGLDVITKIHTISFKYNGKAGYPMDERYVGIIAQEMQEIAPYMISSIKTEDGEEYLEFDPSAMDFITVNSIQEQQQIIKEQEKRINELENRLNKIERLFEEQKFTQVDIK